MQVLKFLIRFFFTIFQYFLKFTPFQLKQQRLISVINYHYFLENNLKVSDPSLEINLNIFNKQLLILLKSNKFIHNSEELSNFFSNNKGIEKKFLITIDDADQNIKKILPIINKLSIPFFLFIPFGFCLGKDDIIALRSKCLHHLYFKIIKDKNIINKKKNLLENFNKIMTLDIRSLKSKYLELIKDNESFFVKKNFLSINDLINLSDNSLITLGSHSMSHVPLSNLPNKWLNWEIEESLKLLKKVKGDCSIFAYPYGHINSYNQNVKKILFKNNIKFAFTTRSYLLNQNTDLLELGRTYFFNNNSKNYILGTAFGSMQLFDKILKR